MEVPKSQSHKSKKMLLFFGYWTYVTMEIARKDVAFFQLLDLCDYGNCQKKCCFFLAIGLMRLWKLLEKMNFFTCDFQTLLCLYFGGSKTFFLFVCISRIFYNLRNHNVVKHSLVENRIFWGLYDFLHQHGSLIKIHDRERDEIKRRKLEGKAKAKQKRKERELFT